ncbi:MAG: HAD-IA family hydrolase [Gemmatimonadaceae bacterium]|nr:HAD-IA family hydrolase [Gemmatimonadaceae bacterium]
MSSPAADLAPPDAVLFDLLMGVMNSLERWGAAARGRERGLAWRDLVTKRMAATTSYEPYERLVEEAAAEIGLAPGAVPELWDRWSAMEPWPDTSAVNRLTVPYAFVTNCSAPLASVAARRSGLYPVFTLSAQEAGWYKPDERIYREACRRLDRPMDRVLFVAGSPYDADGARAAGLSVMQVARRPDHRDEVSNRVVTTLGEIVAAFERERGQGGWSRAHR